MIARGGRAIRFIGLTLLLLTGCAAPVPAPAPTPIPHPYFRGVNNMTFQWFADYGRQAGNESVASYSFEAHHGVSVIRLPIKWETIQPTLGGALDPSEVSRLEVELSRAHATGLDVIVDLHNGCRYELPESAPLTCSRGISIDQFANIWIRLSAVLKNEPGVLAYDLMNEPNDLTADGSNTRADAVLWERFSQAAVDALRSAGDDHQLMVEGVSWSNVDTFAKLHPQAWIRDPRNAVTYSAHDYFNQTGIYTVTGRDAPELSYSYWANRFQTDGTTGTRSFDDWNLNRLKSFIDWLARNRAFGDIGEIGWPSYQEMVASGMSPQEAGSESQHWNTLADKWFDTADAAYLSVTYFAASGLQFITYPGSPAGLPDPNAIFVHGAGNGELRDPQGAPILTPNGRFQPRDMDTANSQWDVLSKHPSSGE